MKRTLIPILVLLLSMPMLLSAKVPVEEDIKARISDPAAREENPGTLGIPDGFHAAMSHGSE